MQASAALGLLEPHAGAALNIPRSWRRGGSGRITGCGAGSSARWRTCGPSWIRRRTSSGRRRPGLRSGLERDPRRGPPVSPPPDEEGPTDVSPDVAEGQRDADVGGGRAAAHRPAEDAASAGGVRGRVHRERDRRVGAGLRAREEDRDRLRPALFVEHGRQEGIDPLCAHTDGTAGRTASGRDPHGRDVVAALVSLTSVVVIPLRHCLPCRTLLDRRIVLKYK